MFGATLKLWKGPRNDHRFRDKNPDGRRFWLRDFGSR